ncbi:MAG: prohibitin family protein [Deltaproteobacteria bacterium]|nr:prohibitin family protein [Deltaproteobacteria bacterium]
MNGISKLRALTLIGIICVLLSGCVVVDDGTVGISKSFGKINKDALVAGVYANVPLFREVEVWNIKTQRLTTRIEIPSSEGLIVGLEVSLLFRPTRVIDLRTQVGSTYITTRLEPALINSFREAIGKERIESLIKKQEMLTTQVRESLIKAMSEQGIQIEELLVTNLALPPNFRSAIERKLESEQKALQKEFELQQAKKDAEIEVVRAEGAAQAQQIVRSTLSLEYLNYLWIKNLSENPNVIYVATEANMPLFRSTPQGSVAAQGQAASGAK